MGNGWLREDNIKTKRLYDDVTMVKFRITPSHKSRPLAGREGFALSNRSTVSNLEFRIEKKVEGLVQKRYDLEV